MKKNTLLIIILLVGIIIVAVLSQFFKPNADPAPLDREFFSTSRTPATSFAGIQYTGAHFAPPTTLPVLSITASTYPDLETNLSQFCQINNTVTNDFGDQTHRGAVCNYYLDGDTFFFFTDESNPVLFTPSSDQNQASTILTSTITSIYGDAAIFTPLAPLTFITDEAPNATQFRFAPHHNQIPIHQHDSAETNLTVIYANGAFVQASFPTQSFTATPQTDFVTISLDQAISNISQGNAYLAEYNEYNYISENSGFITDLSSLREINLTSVTLEYRLNLEETLAIPSYHFSGTARDPQNNTMGVEIITPAINFTITP